MGEKCLGRPLDVEMLQCADGSLLAAQRSKLAQTMTLHLPAKTCNNFAGPAKEFLHVVGMERPRALHRFLDPLEVALDARFV